MKTKCMSCGGSMKKMQKGGSIKKKPLLPKIKPKTGMDAVRAVVDYVTTFGYATKKDDPKQKDINIVKKLKETFSSTKKPMKKMAVGGTTTKRIIKKSTGGMYGIPQENMGTSDQYGFGQKGGTVKKPLKKTRIIDSKIPMKGPGAPVYKPLLAKKGGAVKKMKTGGATKAAKFAALAPPYNKATFADKIVGAKKKK